jgi:hypothetical protein
VTPDEDPVAQAFRQAWVMILALAGGVTALALVVVLLMGSEGASSWTGSLDPGVLPWFAGLAAVLLFLAPRIGRAIAQRAPADARSVIGAWTAGALVTAGLREAVGVGGLVLGLLAGSLPWALGFAGASVGALLLGLPRREVLRERLRWVERQVVADPD